MAERGNGKVIIVQGGQWGSEAKGLITHKLTLERNPSIAIRTGTVNAGHTVYYEGRAYAMQQLPVSWVKPGVRLVLGPGAYIHPDILFREIDWLVQSGAHKYGDLIVYIDKRCGIHLATHTKAAAVANRHHKMGATGKGCSEAVMDKIKYRGNGAFFTTFADWLRYSESASLLRSINWAFCITDTVELVNQAYDRGETLLLEGTQGTLLDLHLGPYPYTTHKQTQAASWLAEAGLSANVRKEIWGVYRTFPIRVAGNSGPMPGEISWTEFTRNLNDKLGSDFIHPRAVEEFEAVYERTRKEMYPHAPATDPAYWPLEARTDHREACSELHALTLQRLADGPRNELLKLWEVTTVTKKLRRIAEWDWETFKKSIQLNRPDYIALTFMNYEFPQYWGYSGYGSLIGPTPQYIEERAKISGCPVGLVSFGPQIENTLNWSLPDKVAYR